MCSRTPGQPGELLGSEPDIGVADGPVPARVRRRPQPTVRHGGVRPARPVAGRQRDRGPAGVHGRRLAVRARVRHQRVRVQQPRHVRPDTAARLHAQVG